VKLDRVKILRWTVENSSGLKKDVIVNSSELKTEANCLGTRLSLRSWDK